MTTIDDIYAAILADPDDIALRLRYADSIRGLDAEHADLIRLQIEYDRLRVAGGDLSASEGSRMRALYARLRGRLSEPVAGLVTRTGLRRGFAELIVLPGADFLADGAEIYRRVPVRHAVLTGVDPGLVAAIAASGLLARLSSLDLSDNPIGDAGVRALVTSPHLGKIRWLGLEGCGIGIDGAEALAAAASQVLPNLRYLRFGGNAVDLVPHGEGWDAVSGQGPVDVHLPELGVRLDERYGPFPWLDARLAWTDFVDFTHV